LLRIYIPWNWELGSALSKLRNLGGGLEPPQTIPLGTPLHNYMFILLLFYCWLIVSASKGHNQANIYQKPKNAGAFSTKCQFYGITFTLISSTYSYYQLADVLFVLNCVEMLSCIMNVFTNFQ
jgi:hypothetical protein